LAARGRMQERQGTRNADLVGQSLQAAAALDAGPEGFMRAAARQLSLTGRGYDRVLRVARTVADLAGAERIAEAHIAEALTFRTRELT
ncbi:MAG: ATP-dependent protease, partial [Deinococcus sp.]|nr:ATP-dependent protease [Deinococcus sp.]